MPMGHYKIVLSLLLCILNFQFLVTSTGTNLETYIVHVELPSPSSSPGLGSLADDLQHWYQTFLPTTPSISSSLSTDNDPLIIYSYHNVFKGFAAKLSPEQAKAMEKIPGFISAHPQKMLPLDTTHSPNFLGLIQNTGLWRDSNYGSGVIIGILDTGINPDHPSFHDVGMPLPPTKWRGDCQFATLLCNNKLIGARHFTIGNGTPYDENGHGTHTASTAAGNFVRGANVFGNANGTAAGVAPLAHIASYKVCVQRCSESDILAAMDAAIDDGVDVISLSLGQHALNFYSESVAVGAFSAMERGIFVSASAGNDGPALGTMKNGAPWILTVGASSIDRKIRATAVLGNSVELLGESTFQPADFPSTQLPLVFPGLSSTNSNASFCLPEALSNLDLLGKIVVCETGRIGRIAKGQAVKSAGGAAMLLINRMPEGYTIQSNSDVLPAVHLTYVDGQRVVAYLNSTSLPTATITYQGTMIGDTRAPELASFSSRGPNPASPGILKPDIIGPGLNILAAWHVSVENNTNTRSNFNVISGTSMSCPHLSGVAALIKKAHPNWSPASIKSALMTTAVQLNLAGNPIQDETRRPANLLGLGAGHVNVLRVTDPGLVYDIHSEDYIPYLCGLGYTDQQMEIIVNRPVRCSEIHSILEQELNYPSFSIILGSSSQSQSQTYNRTVTNVGEANSTYSVGIVGLVGTGVRVEPSRLQFTRLNQSLTYQVTFTRLSSGSGNFDQGLLTWNSTRYRVRSPIVVFFNDLGN